MHRNGAAWIRRDITKQILLAGPPLAEDLHHVAVEDGMIATHTLAIEAG